MSNVIPRSELGQEYTNPVIRKFIRGKYYDQMTSGGTDLPYLDGNRLHFEAGSSEVRVMQKFPFWKFGGMPRKSSHRFDFVPIQPGPTINAVRVNRWESDFVETLRPQLPFKIEVGHKIPMEQYAYVDFSTLGFLGDLYLHNGCNFVGICHDAGGGGLCAVEFSLVGAALILGRDVIYSSYSDGGFDSDYTDRIFVDRSAPWVRVYYQFSEAFYPTITIGDREILRENWETGIRHSNFVAEINASSSNTGYDRTFDEPVLFCDNRSIESYRLDEYRFDEYPSGTGFEEMLSTSTIRWSGTLRGGVKNSFCCPDEGLFYGVDEPKKENLRFYWPANSLVLAGYANQSRGEQAQAGFVNWSIEPGYDKFRWVVKGSGFAYKGAPDRATAPGVGPYAVSSGKKIDITIIVPNGRGVWLVLAAFDIEATLEKKRRSDAVCMALDGDGGGAIKFKFRETGRRHEQVNLNADSSLAPGRYRFLFGALGEMDGHFHCAGDTLDILVIKTKAASPRMVFLLYPARLGKMQGEAKMNCKLIINLHLGDWTGAYNGPANLTPQFGRRWEPFAVASASLSFVFQINAVAIINLNIACSIISERALLFNATQASEFSAGYFLFSRNMRSISDVDAGLDFATKVLLSGDFNCSSGFLIGRYVVTPVEARPAEERSQGEVVRGVSVILGLGTRYARLGEEGDIEWQRTFEDNFWSLGKPWFNVDSFFGAVDSIPTEKMFASLGGEETNESNSSSVEKYGIYLDRETGRVVGVPKLTGVFVSKYEDSNGRKFIIRYRVEENTYISDFALRICRGINPQFASSAEMAVGTRFDKNLYISMLPESGCTGAIVLESNLQCHINGSLGFYADVDCIKNIEGNFACIAKVFTGIGTNVFWGFLEGLCLMAAEVSLANKIAFDGEFIAVVEVEVAFGVYYSNIMFHSHLLVNAEIKSARVAILTVEVEWYA